MTRAAIDLTPLLPGGENGGAKPLALMLVRHLARAAPHCEFLLLTNPATHDELAPLDAPNVRRVCPSHPQSAPTVSRRRALTLRAALLRVLPHSLVDRLGRLYLARTATPAASPLLRSLGAELLFCPFTGILFPDPSIPTVSLVHDLQYLHYPEFFDPADRAERDRYFRHLCRAATRIVCVSEFTRSSVLAHSDVPPERVIAIPSAPQQRFVAPRPAEPGRYLLYPANFWRHKNHEMLLAAFGIYRARHPHSDLRLVLTGAPSPRRDDLIQAARQMRLDAHIDFPGHLPDAAFAPLLSGALAMIFPSLFEGFGMPVLEAMAAGVPVLASNLTSIPEVAGGAALLFDPRRPHEIAEAIARIDQDPSLRATLADKGLQQARDWSAPDEMARKYLQVFEEALQGFTAPNPAIQGVFPDGWTAPRVQISFGPGSGSRRLTVNLEAPPAPVTVRVDPPGLRYRLAPGRPAAVSCDLPPSAGTVELICSPAFEPGGGDRRALGCRLLSAAIVRADGCVQLVKQADAA